MKDQVTALMEALRLSRAEIDKLRRREQSPDTTVRTIEELLSDPVVAAAIGSMESSPSLVPELHDRVSVKAH